MRCESCFRAVSGLVCCVLLSGCFFGLFEGSSKTARTNLATSPVVEREVEESQNKEPKRAKTQQARRENTALQEAVGSGGQSRNAAVASAPAEAPLPDEAALDASAAELPAEPLPLKLEPAASQTPPEEEVAVLTTPFGRIILQLDAGQAPRHAENFKKNIRAGVYDGTTFHRVVKGYIVQGGDPNSKDADRSNDGLGGGETSVKLEKGLRHVRGAVAMARADDKLNPDRVSNGTQFYICMRDASFLDGKYSVFGRVLAGMNVLEAIEAVPVDKRDNPLLRIEMQAALMTLDEALR